MNRIRHNSPSPIQCLWAFHILFFALLFRCYCYNHYKTQKYYFCYRYRYYHITLLLNTLLQILSYPGVVELTTQLQILENILWLPLCRINKFGLNTLPSKTVAIPYTCGLSVGAPPTLVGPSWLHRPTSFAYIYSYTPKTSRSTTKPYFHRRNLLYPWDPILGPFPALRQRGNQSRRASTSTP